MKFNHIVIDGSNLWWRVYTSTLDKLIQKDKKGKYVDFDEKKIYSASIEEMLFRLNYLLDQFGYKKESIVYLLFDNPYSIINTRKLISGGEYKHTRQSKNLPKNIHKALNIMEEILKCYSDNFRILRSEQLEADDLTLPLRDFIKPNKNKQILFISADFDWARNINKNCYWYNYVTLYGIDVFKKEYGFTPVGNTIKLYKAIRGDNSDNIKCSVPNMPEKLLIELVTCFEDVYDLYHNLWKKEKWSEHWKKKLEENKTKVMINYQLVDFSELKLNIKDIMIICKENIVSLKIWFDFFNIPYESKMYITKSTKELAKEFFKKKKNLKNKSFIFE